MDKLDRAKDVVCEQMSRERPGYQEGSRSTTGNTDKEFHKKQIPECLLSTNGPSSTTTMPLWGEGLPEVTPPPIVQLVPEAS